MFRQLQIRAINALGVLRDRAHRRADHAVPPLEPGQLLKTLAGVRGAPGDLADSHYLHLRDGDHVPYAEACLHADVTDIAACVLSVTGIPDESEPAAGDQMNPLHGFYFGVSMDHLSPTWKWAHTEMMHSYIAHVFGDLDSVPAKLEDDYLACMWHDLTAADSPELAERYRRQTSDLQRILDSTDFRNKMYEYRKHPPGREWPNILFDNIQVATGDV